MTHSFWQVARRGLSMRCPNCGKGRLLVRYLTPVKECSYCGEALGHIRADDGPAWLTILMTGHILAPFILMIAPKLDWPNWLSITVWVAVAMMVMFSLLPRAKGFFIRIIWRSQRK